MGIPHASSHSVLRRCTWRFSWRFEPRGDCLPELCSAKGRRMLRNQACQRPLTAWNRTGFSMPIFPEIAQRLAMELPGTSFGMCKNDERRPPHLRYLALRPQLLALHVLQPSHLFGLSTKRNVLNGAGVTSDTWCGYFLGFLDLDFSGNSGFCIKHPQKVKNFLQRIESTATKDKATKCTDTKTRSSLPGRLVVDSVRSGALELSSLADELESSFFCLFFSSALVLSCCRNIRSVLECSSRIFGAVFFFHVLSCTFHAECRVQCTFSFVRL